MIDEKFISERVTKLRIRKGVSEYKMSTDMGHSSSYIHSIASGKAMPSMSEFLYMCEYLGVSPKEFFDEGCADSQAVHKLYQLSLSMDSKDIDVLINMAERLNK